MEQHEQTIPPTGLAAAPPDQLVVFESVRGGFNHADEWEGGDEKILDTDYLRAGVRLKETIEQAAFGEHDWLPVFDAGSEKEAASLVQAVLMVATSMGLADRISIGTCAIQRVVVSSIPNVDPAQGESTDAAPQPRPGKGTEG